MRDEEGGFSSDVASEEGGGLLSGFTWRRGRGGGEGEGGEGQALARPHPPPRYIRSSGCAGRKDLGGVAIPRLPPTF